VAVTVPRIDDEPLEPTRYAITGPASTMISPDAAWCAVRGAGR
jgi:hypothetical protein